MIKLQWNLHQSTTKRKCQNAFYILHENNDFAEISKNSARYMSKNNFIGPSK